MPVERPSDALFFESSEELRDWFEANHETAPELWLGTWKKSTGKPSIAWVSAVDEALCVGWIDSVLFSLDAQRSAQRFTPRRKGSIWSAANVANVARLTAEGRMKPAGLAAFEARRPDRTGVYAFEQPGMPTLTDAEEARFRADAAAWAWFSAKSASYRKQALHWVTSSRRADRRLRRRTGREAPPATRPLTRAVPHPRMRAATFPPGCTGSAGTTLQRPTRVTARAVDGPVTLVDSLIRPSEPADPRRRGPFRPILFSGGENLHEGAARARPRRTPGGLRVARGPWYSRHRRRVTKPGWPSGRDSSVGRARD